MFLANCNNWPLIGSLAGLATLALLCNACLLWRYYKYIKIYENNITIP